MSIFEEAEEKIASIKQIEVTVSTIKQAKNQIESYEKFKEYNELILCPNEGKASRALKNIKYKDFPLIHCTGIRKDKMIDALIEEKNKFISQQEKRLDLEMKNNK